MFPLVFFPEVPFWLLAYPCELDGQQMPALLFPVIQLHDSRLSHLMRSVRL